MPKFYADIDIKAPNLTLTNSGSDKPLLTLESTVDNVTSQPEIVFFKNSASQDLEDLGVIRFKGLNDAVAPETIEYARIFAEVDEVADGEESGTLYLSVANHNGAVNSGLKLTGGESGAVVDVAIANGGTSTTTIAGDLSITTGLLLDGADITAIQTDGDAFADNNTSLMTSGAIADYVTANGGGVTFANEAAVVLGTATDEAISPDTLKDAAWNRTFTTTTTTTGDHQGDICYDFDGTSLAAGKVFYLNSSGLWTLTNCDSPDDSTGMLGVALGNNQTDGVLLRGFVTLFEIQGSEGIGSILYLNQTDGGTSVIAPTGDGDIVRIIGYSLSNTGSGGDQVYFNPDNTFVEYAT